MRELSLVMALVFACVIMQGQAVWPVNNAGDTDDGTCNAAHCTLREALRSANNNVGPDSIIFDIPGAGPHRITIDNALGPLPAILDSNTIINGTSQPGNLPIDGRIIIDGSNLNGIADHGLVVYRSSTKIYGLQIENFPGSGIQIFGGFGDAAQLSRIYLGDEDKGNVIVNNAGYGIEGDIDRTCVVKGNYLGTDLGFNPGLGNGFDGLYFRMRSGNGVVIGGPGGERNYFCSNGYSGAKLEIILGQPDWTGNFRFVGNHVGTDVTGNLDLGNVGQVNGGSFAGGGIFISGDGPMTIGGPGSDANIIAFNYDGIYHDSFDEKTFNQNHWYCNTNAGITLSNGANNNITTPYAICVGDGLVNGLADPNMTIEIFDIDTTVCPGGVPCQGNELIGTTTSDANGYWIWNGAVTPGSTVSILALDGNGNVSEFSTCADYVTVSVYNTGPYCDGDSIYLFADVSGNVQNATFEWFAPGGLLVGETQNVVANTSNRPGTYELYVVFDDCEYPVQTTEVEVNAPSTVTYTDFCAGDSWTVNGNTYDINNTQGTEIVEGVNAFGCDSIYIFDLDFNPSIEGQMTASDRYVCEGDSVEVTFEIQSSAPGPYEVIYTDGSGSNTTLQDVFNGTTITLPVTGELIFEVIDITTPLTICEPTIGESDTVSISTLNIVGDVSDYDGFGVSCKGADDGYIYLDVQGAIGNLTYDWSPVFLDGDSVMALGAGQYSVTVTDEAGCTGVFDTVLTEPIGPDPILEVSEPTCFGAADGMIFVDTVFDVVGQLEWSLDSVNFEPVLGYPLIIDTLTSGIKKIFFRDDSGDCIARFRIIVPQGQVPFVDAGGSLSMASGDSVPLSFETDIISPSVQWSPAEIMGCPTCFTTMASPPFSQFVSVLLTNDQGCTAEDSVLVQVFIPKRAFIPNVFSPNGDNVNDFFVISTNEFGQMIESIIILNRGGVTVFSGRELPLNDPSNAWDGTFKGVYLNPGVFTYLIEIRYEDQQVIPFSGTVTLLR